MSTNIAAIHALLGPIPGLVIHEGITPEGKPWGTVTWPACEMGMEKDATGKWQTIETYSTGGCHLGTGDSMLASLKDALANMPS